MATGVAALAQTSRDAALAFVVGRKEAIEELRKEFREASARASADYRRVVEELAEARVESAQFRLELVQRDHGTSIMVLRGGVIEYVPLVRALEELTRARAELARIRSERQAPEFAGARIYHEI